MREVIAMTVPADASASFSLIAMASQQLFADIKEFSDGILDIRNGSLRSIGSRQGICCKFLRKAWPRSRTFS
jgi:hypothetical protein